MTHYERKVADLMNMPEYATVEAVLGVAYEQRTANLLALNHLLETMRQDGTLGDDGGLLTKVSTQILERLDFTKDTP